MSSEARLSEKIYFLLWILIMWSSCWGRFVVEKNSLKVTSPDALRGIHECAIGNFGIPQYGGTMVGFVVYPKTNRKACKSFHEFDISFKSKPGGIPTFILVDRGDCYFTTKAWNAQNAGAAAILVADYKEEPLITMDTPGEDSGLGDYLQNISIPSALISKSFGDGLKKALEDGEMVSVNLDWRESLPHPDDRVEYEFWTNSNDECGPKCDSQIDFVRTFKGAAQILEKKGYTQFTPHYISWYCPEVFILSKQCKSQCINHGRYCAPDPEQDFSKGYDGRDVVIQNLRAGVAPRSGIRGRNEERRRGRERVASKRALSMGSLRLTDSNIIPHLKRSLCSSCFSSTHVRRHQSPRHRFLLKACSSSDADFASSETRRKFITYTAAVSLSLAPIPGVQQPAKSEEPALSEWERVYLPIDPGVVLLDVAFVPDDLNHGFLLGTRQTILETKDGGNTWFPRSIPSAEDEDFNYRFNSISFRGKEGWIVGKPAILLYTSDAGESWERIPLSSQLPGDIVYIKATGEKTAEMVTDEGAIYTTSNRGYNWRASVQETVSATLNRTVSSGISGASYYTGTFNTVNRSPDGRYVAVSSRGNFYLTWEPGQPYWQPHNRAIARRIQNMGWRADGGLWLLVRGGGLYLSKGTGINEEFEEVPVQSRGFGILDVGYRSKDEAWAAGGSGILLRTTNGGKTWARDKAADNIAANLYSVKFIDDRRGFVLGNDGVLLRYLG